MRLERVYYPNSAEGLCNDGYSVDGTGTGSQTLSISCQADGTFTQVQECLPVSCGRPSAVHNGDMPTELVYYPNTAEGVCNDGYSTDGMVTGSRVLTVSCQPDSTFTQVQECLPVVCGTPSAVNNGNMRLERVYYPNSAEGLCNDGYSVDGTGTGSQTLSISCQADGTFTQVQECLPVSCGRPSAVHNGDMPTELVYYPNTAEGVCNDGYSTDGTVTGSRVLTVSCQPDSTFTQVQECFPVACGRPSIVDNGDMPTELVHYPNSALGSCKDGYSTDGTAFGSRLLNVSCQLDGSFTPVQECLPVACGRPSAVNNSVMPTELVYYPNSAYGSCSDGYSQDGMASGSRLLSVSCQADGTFTQLQECLPVACGRPSAVDNGDMPTELVYYPSTVYGSCSDGYSMDGVASGSQLLSVSCQADGSFSRVQECLPVACGRPYAVHHGIMHAEVVYYPASVEGVCNDGYSTDGMASGSRTLSVSCQANGTFTESQDCLPVACGEPNVGCDSITHAKLVSLPNAADGVYFPDSVYCSCIHGYTMDGMAKGPAIFPVSCQADGTFTQAQVCQPVACGAPGKVNHSRVLEKPVHFPDDVEYTCVTGYTTDGTAGGSNVFHVMCQDDGTFTEALICQPVVRGKPPMDRSDVQVDDHQIVLWIAVVLLALISASCGLLVCIWKRREQRSAKATTRKKDGLDFNDQLQLAVGMILDGEHCATKEKDFPNVAANAAELAATKSNEVLICMKVDGNTCGITLDEWIQILCSLLDGGCGRNVNVKLSDKPYIRRVPLEDGIELEKEYNEHFKHEVRKNLSAAGVCRKDHHDGINRATRPPRLCFFKGTADIDESTISSFSSSDIASTFPSSGHSGTPSPAQSLPEAPRATWDLRASGSVSDTLALAPMQCPSLEMPHLPVSARPPKTPVPAPIPALPAALAPSTYGLCLDGQSSELSQSACLANHEADVEVRKLSL